MSTRIKGNALTLSFGTPTTDYKADVTACTMENEEADSDVTTFQDAANGGARQYFFNITGIQSTDASSLWRYIWDQSGSVVAFTYAPHGNAVASATEPHFVGQVKVGPRPTIGGEAGVNNTYTFETRWDIEGVPTLDEGV